MATTHVAVLRGGPSSEYDVSLATGAAVLEHLPESKYKTKDILIDRDGVWHMRGLPTTPDRALQDVDVVFIGLHGEYGEDGEVQRILDTHAIPYTGSGVFGSKIALNKGHARTQLSSVSGIKMPQYVVIESSVDYEQAAQKIFAQFGPAYIVKPLTGGSSVGVQLAHSLHELMDALAFTFRDSEAVIVEQFIQGREATCGVLESFRGEDFYALPPVEIINRSGGDFWDYNAKYDGSTDEVCPANFSAAEKELLQAAARDVHQHLGLNHYSRSDFIVAPSGIYFLEVNTLPGLTPESLLPKSIEAVGASLPDFLDHVVTLAHKQ